MASRLCSLIEIALLLKSTTISMNFGVYFLGELKLSTVTIL